MKAVRLPAALLALGLVAALVAVFAMPAGAASTGDASGLTVTGMGSVKVVPDVVTWSFGVQTNAATARDALRLNSTEVAKVIDALKAAGVAEKDIQTEQVSLFPRTNQDGTQVVGYSASNSVSAIVRDLAKAGAVVDAAAEAGSNQISGPSLTVSDSERFYEQALNEAYVQALVKARRLAAKAGVRLGRPVQIVEGGGQAPIPFTDGAKAAAGVPIQPGTTEIQASVTVTFAIR